MRNIRNLAFAGVSLLSLAAPAFAQEAASAPAAGVSDEDIIVTGTLIRGIAPGGSQSIGVGQEKITEVGAANTSDLIASVPQAGNFLGFRRRARQLELLARGQPTVAALSRQHLGRAARPRCCCSTATVCRAWASPSPRRS